MMKDYCLALLWRLRRLAIAGRVRLVSLLIAWLMGGLVASATWFCLVEVPYLCAERGCIADCRTKQCYWNGLPITLYLGVYLLEDVWSITTVMARDVDGYGSSIDGTMWYPADGEIRTEQNCNLNIQPIVIWVGCPFSVGDPYDPCPA